MKYFINALLFLLALVAFVPTDSYAETSNTAITQAKQAVSFDIVAQVNTLYTCTTFTDVAYLSITGNKAYFLPDKIPLEKVAYSYNYTPAKVKFTNRYIRQLVQPPGL